MPTPTVILVTHLQTRQAPTTAHVAITADGAEWIWKPTADLFHDRVQIVNGYHATAYLARAANALYPTDAEAASRWQQAQRHILFMGETYKISVVPEQAGLATHAGYFQRHTRRMQYQTFREDGYSIGSGAVESGIKQFKQRLAGHALVAGGGRRADVGLARRPPLQHIRHAVGQKLTTKFVCTQVKLHLLTQSKTPS